MLAIGLHHIESRMKIWGLVILYNEFAQMVGILRWWIPHYGLIYIYVIVFLGITTKSPGDKIPLRQNPPNFYLVNYVYNMIILNARVINDIMIKVREYSLSHK